MATVKAWKLDDPSAPKFPDDFEISKKAVLQVTDIKSNHNKYYAIELHTAKVGGKPAFRVFTHYGRTDDLETNPNAGAKECRFFTSVDEALATYDTIYREKTSSKKGYKELSLASSKIGSQKARGTSSGTIDAKTIEKIKSVEGAAPVAKKSALSASVQEITRYIYDEAKIALTTTVAAKITANGIETPLGVLTMGQIEKGEEILLDLYELFKTGSKKITSKIENLSSEFYTVIPHRIGRTRTAIESSVIDTMASFEQKQETLQLMKDMLSVNGEGGNVLYGSEIDAQYEALKCRIAYVDHDAPEYRQIADYVIKSQVKTKSIKVQNIFTLMRDHEHQGFASHVGNERLMFHGSRIKNWVGILSRGILMPKIVVSMGVNRTDAGWLGNGIYFGDAACTAAFYTTPGSRKTRLMSVARVALGKVKDFHKITYGINEPIPGYDSHHGVRRSTLVRSEFDDDEYVIYNQSQQRMEYLVEFTA
jgi:poly [ADP-ribose] polymerase